MYFVSLPALLIVMTVGLLLVVTPGAYAVHLAHRALADYTVRRAAEGRTLAWRRLALLGAFAAGVFLAVITWATINFLVIPAAIADLSITAYNRRVERRMRIDAGLEGPDVVALPRAYALAPRHHGTVAAA